MVSKAVLPRTSAANSGRSRIILQRSKVTQLSDLNGITEKHLKHLSQQYIYRHYIMQIHMLKKSQSSIMIFGMKHLGGGWPYCPIFNAPVAANGLNRQLSNRNCSYRQ